MGAWFPLQRPLERKALSRISGFRVLGFGFVGVLGRIQESRFRSRLLGLGFRVNVNPRFNGHNIGIVREREFSSFVFRPKLLTLSIMDRNEETIRRMSQTCAVQVSSGSGSLGFGTTGYALIRSILAFSKRSSCP